MNSLIYTLPHASSFDIHNSNLHFPCSVPGKNLIVTTKRCLEYPQCASPDCATRGWRKSQTTGRRPSATVARDEPMQPFLQTHGTCHEEGTTSGDVQVRADITGGDWMRILDRFECRNSVVEFHYCGVAVRRQDRGSHAQVVGAPTGSWAESRKHAVGSGGGRRSGA